MGHMIHGALCNRVCPTYLWVGGLSSRCVMGESGDMHLVTARARQCIWRSRVLERG